MALNPITESTLHAAFLGALSNVIAQVIRATRQGVDYELDFVPVFQFLLFSMISTPPNFLWQSFLERNFPAYPEPPSNETSNDNKRKSDDKKTTEKKPEPKLSIRNTIIKLLLDQTLAAALNTLLFSTVNRTLQAAMPNAPHIPSLFSAVSYWTSPGALDFEAVDFAEVWRLSCDEFWPILKAGWKFWPGVAVVNYTMIRDVKNRNLMGAVAGIAWGTYMSLLAAK